MCYSRLDSIDSHVIWISLGHFKKILNVHDLSVNISGLNFINSQPFDTLNCVVLLLGKYDGGSELIYNIHQSGV